MPASSLPPSPPSPPSRNNPPGPTSDTNGIARPHVLVVDDEPLMGKAIARLLAECEVFALTSARVAMDRIIAGETFDVILCDVMIPDFSGIDLHEGIARHAPGLLPRLVFVTGGAYTPEAIAFLDRVPNLRLEKPILPEALLDAVASILKSADS